MRETIYEWVVETLADDGSDDPDILDCSYWPENELYNAIRQYKNIEGPADFGLCYRVVDSEKGDLDRQYAYVTNNKLGKDFDGGRPIPQRLLRDFSDFWQSP